MIRSLPVLAILFALVGLGAIATPRRPTPFLSVGVCPHATAAALAGNAVADDAVVQRTDVMPRGATKPGNPNITPAPEQPRVEPRVEPQAEPRTQPRAEPRVEPREEPREERREERRRVPLDDQELTRGGMSLRKTQAQASVAAAEPAAERTLSVAPDIHLRLRCVQCTGGFR